MTIHKSQGASLDYAQLDLGNTVFADGQTYVGLSRVRSLEGLYLSAFNPLRIRANPLVRAFYESIPDVDYPELVLPSPPPPPPSVDTTWSKPETETRKLEFSHFAYSPDSTKQIHMRETLSHPIKIVKL